MKRLSVYLCFALAVLLAAPAHAYKPQCKDASGRLIQCTGTLDNSQAPAAIAAGTITGTLGVSQGGTGATAVTAHGVMVANGSGTALQSTNAPTTPGQHLIWDGAQWLPGLQTASSGSAVLGAAFPLTSTDTYQDTGLSVSTPSGGEHQITAQVKATLLATTGSPYATCRLYNVTAGAVLANSELFVAFSPAAGTYGINTATAQKTYTLAAASTIRLECARRQATVWSVSEISSDVDGRTVLSYVKLAS